MKRNESKEPLAPIITITCDEQQNANDGEKSRNVSPRNNEGSKEMNKEKNIGTQKNTKFGLRDAKIPISKSIENFLHLSALPKKKVYEKNKRPEDGAFSVRSQREVRERKLTLLRVESTDQIEDMTYHTQKTSGVKKNEKYRGRKLPVIRSSLNLLLLLMIRAGPNLFYEESLEPYYGAIERKFKNVTIEHVRYAIGLTYWIGSFVSYILFLIPGLIILFSKMFQYYSKHIQKIAFLGSNKFVIHVMLVVTIVQFLGQTLFAISVMLPLPFWCLIVGRAMFSVTDGILKLLQYYFIAEEFEEENFPMAIGFVVSVWSLMYAFTANIFWLSLNYIMSIAIISSVSNIHSSSYPLKAASVVFVICYKLVIRKEFKCENKKDALPPPGKLWSSIGWFFLRIIICVILSTFFYTGWIFPANTETAKLILVEKYGRYIVPNLVLMGQLAYYARALWGPTIGALLFREYKDSTNYDLPQKIQPSETGFHFCCWFIRRKYVNDTNRDYWERLKPYFTFKFHYGIFIVGLVGSSISNWLILYCNVYDDLSRFQLSLLATFYGIFLSAATCAIYSLPMVWLIHLRKELQAKLLDIRIAYPCIISIILMFYTIASTVKQYVMTTEFSLFLLWLICQIIPYIVLIFTLIAACYILYKKRYICEFIGTSTPESDDEDDDYDTDLVEFSIPTNQDKTMKKPKRFTWMHIFFLPYLVIQDVAIAIFAIVVLFTMTGITNIILYYYYSPVHKVSIYNLFFLPILSISCIVSIKLAFPGEISRTIGLFFFKNIRRIFRLQLKPTISQHLEENSEFSLAANIIKNDHKYLWKRLQNRHYPYKIVLKLLPDDRRLTPNLHTVEHYYLERDEFNKKYQEFKKDPTIHVSKKFANGCIIKVQSTMRMIPKIDYSTSKTRANYYFRVLLVYSLFFALPILYHIYSDFLIYIKAAKKPQKWDPPIPDSIGLVITICNFFLGYFIFVPLIGLWLKIYEVLKVLVIRVKEYNKEVKQRFTISDYPVDDYYKREYDLFRNITISKLRLWDIEFEFLQTEIASKIEYIKTVILYSTFLTKFLSTTVTLLALFSSRDIDPSFIQIGFLACALEIIVMFYITHPAAQITSTMEGIRWTLFSKYIQFRKYVYENEDPEISNSLEYRLSSKEMKDMKLVYRYWDNLVQKWKANTVGVVIFDSKTGISWTLGTSHLATSITMVTFTLLPTIVRIITSSYLFKTGT